MTDNVIPFRSHSERLAEDVCHELGKTREGQTRLVAEALSVALDAAGGEMATEAVIDGLYQWLRKSGMTNMDWIALCGKVAAREYL